MDTRNGNIYQVGEGSGAASALASLPNMKPMAVAPTAAQLARTIPHVGRNEPCPCGSGKKFKRCCLEVQSAAASAANPHKPMDVMWETCEESSTMILWLRRSGKFTKELSVRICLAFANSKLLRNVTESDRWAVQTAQEWLDNPCEENRIRAGAAVKAAKDVSHIAAAVAASLNSESALYLLASADNIVRSAMGEDEALAARCWMADRIRFICGNPYKKDPSSKK